MLARLVDAMQIVATGLLAALLPDPERGALAARCGVNPAPYSLAIGLAQLALAPVLYYGGLIGALDASVSPMQDTLFERWTPELTMRHVIGTGALSGLAWFLHPACWLALMLLLTGFFRAAAFVTAQGAVGEPLVVLALRVGQALGRLGRGAEGRARLGPARPDRLIESADGSLTIVSARARPEWSAFSTLQVGERFFTLARVDEVPDRGRRALAYRFRPLPESALIRGLVVYDETGAR